MIETNKQFEEQEQSLEKFKERKMKQTLNYKTMTMRYQTSNLLSRIWTTMLTKGLFFLLRNVKKNTKKRATLEKQLDNVFIHIEDLEEVNQRVRQSEKSKYYKNAIASTKSTIRLDY